MSASPLGSRPSLFHAATTSTKSKTLFLFLFWYSDLLALFFVCLHHALKYSLLSTHPLISTCAQNDSFPSTDTWILRILIYPQTHTLDTYCTYHIPSSLYPLPCLHTQLLTLHNHPPRIQLLPCPMLRSLIPFYHIVLISTIRCITIPYPPTPLFVAIYICFCDTVTLD
jgi:hypothetical protein